MKILLIAMLLQAGAYDNESHPDNEIFDDLRLEEAGFDYEDLVQREVYKAAVECGYTRGPSYTRQERAGCFHMCEAMKPQYVRICNISVNIGIQERQIDFGPLPGEE